MLVLEFLESVVGFDMCHGGQCTLLCGTGA
jgi:hypothetical protein